MSLKKLWHRAVNRAYDDSYELARVGKHNPDTSVTFAVAGRADYLWVTLSNQTTVQARNDAGVPQTIDLEVWVRAETNAGGGPPTYVIESRSAAGILSAPDATPPSGVLAHGSTHQHGGSDEIATATPAANAIPKADASGLLNDWVTPPPVTSVNTQTGDVVLDADDIDDTTTTHKFATAAELSKLAGIEAGANLYVHPNHTGEVTSSGDGATTIANDAVTTAKIANDAVTNAKAANMAQSTIKGRASGAGTGDPTDLTATQVRTILNVADNADNTATAINGAADLGAPADTDKLAVVRGGSLGTILISALKTALDALYVGLTGNQDVSGIKKFLDSMIIGAGSVAGTANLYLTQVGAALMRINSDTSDNPEIRLMLDGSTVISIGYLRADGTFRIGTTTSLGAAQNLILKSGIVNLNGLVGINMGTAAPQGALHVHDGTGGSLFVTKTGVNGTAQTILDGANDVLRRCVITYVLWATDNTMSAGSTISIANNTSFQVFVDAGSANGVTFAVASNGTLTVQRTTGSKTFTLAAHVVWL